MLKLLSKLAEKYAKSTNRKVGTFVSSHPNY